MWHYDTQHVQNRNPGEKSKAITEKDGKGTSRILRISQTNTSQD